MKKIFALLLVCSMLTGILAMPASAYSDDPLARKNFAEFGAVPDETEPKVTTPQETEPAQTEPAETVCEETEPEETQAATVPVTQEPQDGNADILLEATEPEEMTVETLSEPEDPNAPRGHNGVPLYFQTDYPNNMYGMGTIASNGCSAACLAMIATYMTGHEYLPDEIARYFGGAAENNIARMENGSKTMRLPFKKSLNWHETLAALHEGKVAVVLVEAASMFTDSQHFIILTGFNEEGKIMVNDSYEPNYEKWDTKNGLRNGFTESEILTGYSGAWIYDKSAMPEEPFLYSEPEPVRGEPRYGIELSWEEYQMLAKVVWVEARGECDAGQQAVAEVVLNRLVSEDFPNTLKNVIHAEGQFNSAKFLDKAKPYQKQYEIIENALYGPYVLPEDVYYFATSAKTSKVWGQIGGHIFCYAENE